MRYSDVDRTLRLIYFRSQLPDIDFPINAMAEGRILVPWEYRKYPNLTDSASTMFLTTRSCLMRAFMLQSSCRIYSVAFSHLTGEVKGMYGRPSVAHASPTRLHAVCLARSVPPPPRRTVQAS